MIAAALSLLLLGLQPGAAGPPGCPNYLPPAESLRGARPLLVLLQRSQWAGEFGSDSPRLALYGDGFLIYRRSDGFRSVRLDPDELDALRSALAIASLACFVGHYSATSATDQVDNYLYLGRGGALSLVHIYGSLEPALDRSRVPAPLLAAYDRLMAFDHPRSAPWLPDRIEVTIWPYEGASRAVPWPRDWPSLESGTTIRRGEGYSLFIPGSEYERLRNLVERGRSAGAVEIGGRRWSAGIRFPFPGEPWMGRTE